MIENFFLLDLLKTIPIIIPFIFLLKLTGSIVRKFFPFGPLAYSTFDTIHGLLIVVFATSLVIKGWLTTMLTIPLYFILCSIIKQEKEIEVSAHWWKEPIYISFYFILYISHSLIFSFRDGYTINMPYIDEFFCINLASQISKFGYETNDYRAYWLDDFAKNSIYHYFEIWGAILIQKITNIKPVFSFRYGIYPLFLGLSSFHFFKGCKLNGMSKTSSFIISMFIPILGSYTTFEMLELPNIPHTLRIFLTYLSDFIPANRLKLSVLLLFFSMVFFLWKNGRNYFFWPLFLAIFFWPLTAHSIGITFAILLLSGNFSLKTKFKAISIGLINCILFYFASIGGSQELSGSYESDIFLQYKSFRIIFGTFSYNIIAFFICIIPCIIAIGFNHKKVSRYDFQIFFLIAFSLLISSITNSVTIGNVDSFQFFVNLASPVISLSLAYAIIFLIHNTNKIVIKIFAMLFLSYQLFAFYRIFSNNMDNFNRRYSNSYVNFLGSKKQKTWRGISLIKPDGYFKGLPYLNQTGSFIIFYENSCITPINIGENIKLIKEKSILHMNMESPFLKQFSKSGINDTSTFRKQFIINQKINFLAVDKEKDINQYPDLKEMFTLACVDTISGERLYLLNNLKISE